MRTSPLGLLLTPTAGSLGSTLAFSGPSFSVSGLQCSPPPPLPSLHSPVPPAPPPHSTSPFSNSFRTTLNGVGEKCPGQPRTADIPWGPGGLLVTGPCTHSETCAFREPWVWVRVVTPPSTGGFYGKPGGCLPAWPRHLGGGPGCLSRLVGGDRKPPGHALVGPCVPSARDPEGVCQQEALLSSYALASWAH